MKSSLCRMLDSRKCGLMERYLQALFFHQGYTDDSVYGTGEEDGVCRRNYIRIMVKGSSTSEDFMVRRRQKGNSPIIPFYSLLN